MAAPGLLEEAEAEHLVRRHEQPPLLHRMDGSMDVDGAEDPRGLRTRSCCMKLLQSKPWSFLHAWYAKVPHMRQHAVGRTVCSMERWERGFRVEENSRL
jgi:hypothetical protein